MYSDAEVNCFYWSLWVQGKPQSPFTFIQSFFPPQDIYPINSLLCSRHYPSYSVFPLDSPSFVTLSWYTIKDTEVKFKTFPLQLLFFLVNETKLGESKGTHYTIVPQSVHTSISEARQRIVNVSLRADEVKRWGMQLEIAGGREGSFFFFFLFSLLRALLLT